MQKNRDFETVMVMWRVESFAVLELKEFHVWDLVGEKP